MSKIGLSEESGNATAEDTKKGNASQNKPKNVSSHLWEKFKALEKRTNETTQRSTEKRIKHLQKTVLDTVAQEFTSPEDQDMLRKCDVKLPSHENTRKRKADGSLRQSTSTSVSQSDTLEANKVEDLKSWMDVNNHLHLTDHSRPPPPTALQKNIDDAIKRGDFSLAESLSDHLATREAGEKVVAAIDAKRYMEKKKAEEESAKAKRKKKLNWGFEPKHRWETKGNM